MKNIIRTKLVWKFAKKYLFLFIIAEICIAVTYTVSIILPTIFSRLVDEVFTNGKYYILPEIIRNYIILFFISSSFNFIYAFIWQYLNNHYLIDIKTKIFKTVISSKASNLSNMNSGDVISRIDSDGNQFLHIIQRNAFHMINSIIMCLTIILIVGRLNYMISIFLVLAAGLPIVLTRICKKYTEKYSKESKRIIGEVTGKFFEFIKGLREIKLANASKWLLLQLLNPFIKDIELCNKKRRIDFIVNKGTYLINLSTSILIYWYSIHLVNINILTLGELLLVINYIGVLHRKFNWILRIYLDWYSRRISIDRVGELLNTEIESSEGLSVDKISSIQFKNVSFSYIPNSEILSQISFKLESDDKIGIVGTSGIGKTTIISLILYLYAPSSGEILINNIPIEKISVESIRNKIGVVSQDIVLFEDSIRYNLNLGFNCTDNEIWDALSAVNMKDVVEKLPNGLDTVIGMNNQNLSGGQKQRIMIARVILKNPDLIILDEATSALDMENERLITSYLNTKSTSMIIISHRFETIKNCSKILVLENSKIESFGNPDQLLLNSMEFRRLFGGNNETKI